MNPQIARDIQGVKNTPLDAADLSNLIDSHQPYFAELQESAKENELYFRGENLSKRQKKDYSGQSRSHFPIPNVADKLSRIISSERNSRTSAKAEATKPDSEILAELVTLRFRKLERDSNMEYTESEVFASGVGVKYGVIEWVTEPDKQGKPVILAKKRDYLDVMWDSNAREYDKSDGAFFAHRKKVYRLDIRRDYGDKLADAIEINTAYWGRKTNENWGVQDKQGRRDFDVIYIYRVFVKVLKDTYHVIFATDDYSFSTKKEAEEHERMLKIPYILQDAPIPQSDIVKVTDYGYDYYETTLNEILKYEETDLEGYPFEVYQSFQFENEIWCMTDLLKPGNKLMDKLLAQIDYAIGTDVKNGWELVVPWLAEGYSLEKAVQKIKAGEVLPVLRPGALHSIPQKGANPQWMELMGILDSMSDKYTGGDLFSGVQKGKGKESAQAVAMKMKQQELIATLFIDNLRRWKRGLFKKALWFLKKYDTAEDIQKVYGKALSPEMIQLLQENQIYTPSQTNRGIGYIRINNPENQLSILKNAEVDINIVEESISDAQKETQYQRMILTEQSNPLLSLSSTWTRLKLEKIDIPYEDRVKVISEVEQAQQQQQAQAQQDKQQAMNLEKAKILVSDKGNQVGQTR